MSVEVWAGWVFFFTIFGKEKMWKLGMERNARIRERNEENGTKKEEKNWDTELLNYILIYWFIWCFVFEIRIEEYM